ncbi:flagellar basal body-associated FliL family protein [Paenibacillus sp. SC116]|uniref:flagellar basal body-associated FliL family protein n=1 Tax=Paenibacillus sp. SC116 TaxID=2968986 RepID=UPI00215AB646|nr:flagellar basal body-associated FliL family protein [Paenibacillus sp. SC116]MCR8845456.1 flagellar basal body-associated FliL family protein [Paenibacillus sp. SC116]
MKRMLPWMITMLLAITLVALVIIMVINSMSGNSEGNSETSAVVRLSADEIVEMTSELKDIKTNLAGRDTVVAIDFAFQLDSKKTKEEFEKIKELIIKPEVLKTLADTKPEDLEGTKGKDQLSAKLLDLINKKIPEGKVIQVDITNFIMQRI